MKSIEHNIILNKMEDNKEKIVKILKRNKYEDDFAGSYPYSPEEQAQMIIDEVIEKL